MFGTNVIRKQVKDNGASLAVQEMFYTIQGEGPFAGTPAIFIRLAGCNLACTFCDTDFESNILNVVDVIKLANEVADMFEAYTRKYRCEQQQHLVVLTGGEPLRQNVVPLLENLRETIPGVLVQIETAGTVWPEFLDHWFFDFDVHLVCSPKTGKIHPKVVENCLHWKYIISASDDDFYEDGLPNKSTQTGTLLPLYRPEPTQQIWLQPCDEGDPVKNEANIKEVAKRCLTYGYRASIQQHKILGVA